MIFLYKLEKKVEMNYSNGLEITYMIKKLCRNQRSKSDICHVKTESTSREYTWNFSFSYNNINDLVTNIKCMAKHFADDTPLYIVVYSADTSVCLPNNDLEQIHK